MFRPTATFCKSLAFIQTHERGVCAGDLPDTMLEAWIDPQPEDRIAHIKAARSSPTWIYKETPDEQSIPLKVFVYTYDRFSRRTYRGRGPERWLDPMAEKRYLQFQLILRTIRDDRERGTSIRFPDIDIFDYGNYARIVREICEPESESGRPSDRPF